MAEESLLSWQVKKESRFTFAEFRITIADNTCQRTSCRVETWRGGLGLSLSVAGPFVGRCLNSSALLRFHVPLLKPDVRISRIRLSFRTLGLRIQHV